MDAASAAFFRKTAVGLKRRQQRADEGTMRVFNRTDRRCLSAKPVT